MDSDARLAEMREQLLQIRAASESTEEKLRSEVKIAASLQYLERSGDNFPD